MLPLDALESQLHALEECGAVKINHMSHSIEHNMWLFDLDVIVYNTHSKVVQWAGRIRQPGKYQQAVKDSVLFKIRNCFGDGRA